MVRQDERGAAKRTLDAPRSAPGESIAGATTASASTELLHQPPNLREVEEFAGSHHAHRLILLPIEVPWSGVHRDDELRACRQRAFQKAVVGLVPDDAQFGQRIADEEALDNLSDELRVVAQDIRVLLEDRRTDPRLNQVGACEFKDERGRVVLAREGGELQNAGSKTTRKVGPGASQSPRASLGFDERNRFAFGYRLAAVLAVCSRQRRGELEPDDLAFNDGCRIHDISVRKEADRHKRRQ